jgi:hypothetical protein
MANSGTSSTITSITNNYLQIDLWPLEKNSSQCKHLPRFRHCVISAGVKRLVSVGGPLTKVIDDA